MKHVMNLFGMIIVAVIFYAILTFVEAQYLLPRSIIPVPGVRLDQWLSSFRLWGVVGIFTALAASLLWYILAQWVFRVNNLSDAGPRKVWGLLIFIPIVPAVAAWFFARQAQAGIVLANVLYCGNALLCYYFSTVFFSPSSHKFVPPLASVLRPLLRRA
jgi:hypothetical protein